jgi:hypothetical protein
MGLIPKAAFASGAVGAAIAYLAVVRYLYSVSEVHTLSAAQVGVACFYGCVLSLWLGAEVGFLVARRQPEYESIAAASTDDELELVAEDDKDSDPPQKPAKTAEPTIFSMPASVLPLLRLAAEFVLIMGYIYLADRTVLIAKGPKLQTKLGFWLLNLAILAAGVCSMRGGENEVATGGSGGGAIEAPVKPLQRDQTEEWKGWMQIMFVLYHYFAEAEIYNAIRMYIAAYVWMTGFGNFSYYYVRKDFTAVRFVQMMWRLNFFVFFVCITMNNEYMLYYICPMHTFFTWGVFVPLYIRHDLNDSFKVLGVKIALTLAGALALYDLPGVFNALMSPLSGLLAFHDPLHPENAPMHEWFFRSGLDHLVWVFGMLCALSFPFWERKLQEMEELEPARRQVVKSTVLGATLVAVAAWYWQFFSLPKRSYNRVHPFTSFIPIFLYLVLRNITAGLRRRHMHMFAWCGKITLETYILQVRRDHG